MIDLDELRRMIAGIDGDVVPLLKSCLQTLIDQLEAGYAARRTLVNARAVLCAPSAIVG